MAHDDGPFIFRINENGSGPNLLVQVCSERGWREYNENTPLRDNWNLWWRTNGFPSSTYKSLKMWQFTNHIPKASSICRKDTLARYLRCMRKVYGSVYDFSPSVYNLPLEYNKLVAECSRNRTTAHEDDDVWICKPVGLSQGRGIYLFRRLSELTYDTNTIVQRYIRNPLLIGGYKCDLRLYVCVTSYHPLAIYLYREGLVRFSTDKFSLNDLDNPFCHLTNCSLNKMGPGYFEKKDRVGSGCKWTLKQLRHYFSQSGMEDWLLWQRVAAIVVLTVLTQVPFIPNSPNCFEFLGFDILVDSSLRPWLLEVNLSPALGNDCDVDPAVKKPMLHDLFDLLGLPVRNTGLSLFTMWDSPAAPQPAALTQRAAGSRPPRGAGAQAAGDPTLAVVTAAQHWRHRHHQKKQQQQQRTAAAHAFRCAEDDDDDEDPEDDDSSGGRSPAGRQARALVAGAGPGAHAHAHAHARGVAGAGAGAGRARRSIRRGLSAPTVGASSTASSGPPSPGAASLAAPPICVTALTVTSRQATASPPPRGERHSRATAAAGGGGGGGGGGRRAPPSPSPTPAPAPAPAGHPALRVTPVRLCAQRGDSQLASRAGCNDAGPGACPAPRTRSASRTSGNAAQWGRNVDPLLMDRQRMRAVAQRGRLAQTALWGNGKDWAFPSAREGDWVRVYPMCDPGPYPASGAGGGGGGGCFTGPNGYVGGAGEGTSGAVGDPEVRRAVAEVNRMLRVAREVARKYSNCNDNDRSRALSDHMTFNGEVWLPRK